MREDGSRKGGSKPRNNNPELLGKRFNNLTITGFEHRNNCWMWICKCDCGKLIVVAPQKVRTGHTKSCGCKKAERVKNLLPYRIKHNGRHERLYSIWHGMKERCYTKTNNDYNRYGGRGIAVCDEWKTDYACFRDWALNNGYTDEMSIDRIDVNDDYKPSNCRWILMSEQARNKRNTITVEIDGKQCNLAEECERRGLKYGTVYARIFRYGVEPSAAFSAKE